MLSPHKKALEKARVITEMLVEAVRGRSVLKTRYYLSKDHKLSVSDLAVIEKSLDAWVKATLRSCGTIFPRGWKMNIDLTTYKHSNDGENYLEVVMDFAKIFPSEELGA